MELNIEEIVKSFTDSELLNRYQCKKQNKIRNEMRKEMKFCDVTLKINEKHLFKVHKTIIASSCPYFMGMFNGDWKETREDVISLDYKISPECFEIILEYIYTGKFELTKISLENAKIIHEAALFFNLEILKKILSVILEKFVTNDNLLEMWRHGVKFLDNNLKKKCIENISTNAVEFIHTNLLELNFMEIINLLENNEINCSQEDIYSNIIKWMKADLESREKYLKDLLNCVDFSKISGEFLKFKILNDKIFYKNKDFINKIMGELSNNPKIRLKTNADFADIKFKKILLISNTGIFKIDLDIKKCIPLLKHKINRKGFAVNKFGYNNILISGGLNSNICENYSPDLNLIREFPPMLEKRWKHRVLAVNSKIYAFGGYENDTMEIFDLNSEKWNYGPKMLRTRWDFGLAEYDKVFHILNGYSSDSTDHILTDTFDIKLCNKWKSFAIAMKVFVKSVAIDKTAYIFLDNAFEQYDLSNNKCCYNLKVYYNNKYKLSTYDAIKFENCIFILGKELNSDELFSGLLNIRKNALEYIEIDFSECGDIGNEFNLITAYL